MQYFDGSNKVQNVRKWCYYYLMVFKCYMGVTASCYYITFTCITFTCTLPCLIKGRGVKVKLLTNFTTHFTLLCLILIRVWPKKRPPLLWIVLFIYLFTCLFIYLFIHLFIYSFFYLFICFSYFNVDTLPIYYY